MANIFHSQEIYRKIRKREDDVVNLVVPIRGMYVVGYPEIPDYKNSGIVIHDVGTVKPTIADYTEATISAADESFMGLTKFTFNPGITVSRYTKTNAKDSSSFMGLTKFKFNNLTLYRYTQQHSDDKNSIMGLPKFVMSGFSYEHIPREDFESTPEPTVMIKNVYTQKCTITDSTEGG